MILSFLASLSYGILKDCNSHCTIRSCDTLCIILSLNDIAYFPEKGIEAQSSINWRPAYTKSMLSCLVLFPV